MSKLCERPGCSEPGAAVYGMVAEDLLFWIVATDADTPADAKLLCRRHADAMVVPRGWTLDDRREPVPSLFQIRRYTSVAPVLQSFATGATSARRQVRQLAARAVEQLQIDGTGEIPRPSPEALASAMVPDEELPAEVAPVTTPEAEAPQPAPEPVVHEAPETVVHAVPEPVVHVVLESPVEPSDAAEPDDLAIEIEAETTETEITETEITETEITETEIDAPEDATSFGAWRPDFDIDDDLDGLMKPKSPLLSRAFRGTARQR